MSKIWHLRVSFGHKKATCSQMELVFLGKLPLKKAWLPRWRNFCFPSSRKFLWLPFFEWHRQKTGIVNFFMKISSFFCRDFCLFGELFSLSKEKCFIFSILLCLDALKLDDRRFPLFRLAIFSVKRRFFIADGTYGGRIG